jgi:hypothetical protein
VNASRYPRPFIVAAAWPALPEHRDLHEGPVPGSIERWTSLRQRIADVRSSWRVHDEFGLGLRAGTRFEFRDARGYQDPLSLQRYSRVINSIAHTPALLPQYNVRYLFRGPHFIHGNDHHFLPAGSEPTIADDRGHGLWEVRDALPAAYWVSQAERLADGDAVFARLRQLAPARVCLLEGADAPPSTGPIATRDADHFAVQRNRVDLDVDAPDAGWLVVNEAWYPGWHASVDGNETAIERANYLMRAIRVPIGRHHIAMWFAPTYDAPLRMLAAAAFVLAIALVAWPRRRATT